MSLPSMRTVVSILPNQLTRIFPHFTSKCIQATAMVHNESKHLKTGDPQPPVQKGLLRLYTMRYCPYAQRVHLVLDSKKIPHDIVFANLSDKPEWLFDKSVGAKVPAIEYDDGRILSESLVISDYLDEAYPEVPLYPKCAFGKAKDKLLLEQFSTASSAFFKLIATEGGLNAENFETLLKIFEVYEKELQKKNTTFLGGAKPGMVDLMIWPWFERLPLLAKYGGDSFKLPADRLPKLTSWVKAMIADDGVKVSYITPDEHSKFWEARKAGKLQFDF